MRAEPRKETSRSAVAARARTLIASHLGWLEGFPLEAVDGGVRWMSLPASAPAREMVLDGQHLSRATYALNKLRGELAPALALAVDEPEDWLSSVESRLERLKGAVHKGDRLSRRFFQDVLFPSKLREEASALTAGEPRLKPLLNALAWLHAGQPESFRKSLGAVAEWGPGFEGLGTRLGEVPALVTLLRLAQLAADHGRDRVQPLAACLFSERAHDTVMVDAGQVCAQIVQGLGRRARSPLPETLPQGSNLGRDLAGWCGDLVQQSRRIRQQVLHLFELGTPLPLVERWAEWWETARRLLRDAHRLRALPYERESRQALKSQVERHRKTTPPAFVSDHFLEALRRHTSGAAADRTEPLLRALALLPADAAGPGRLHFAVYWSLFGEFGPDAPAHRVVTLLTGFERYLKATSNLTPWARVLEDPTAYWGTFEYEIVVEILTTPRPRRMILGAYDYLAGVVHRHKGLSPDDATRAIELYFLAGDPAWAAAAFDALRAKERLGLYASTPSEALALRLCRERPESFADILKALAAEEDREGLPPSGWPEPLVAALSTGAVGDLVRDLLVTNQIPRLLACGAKAALLAAAYGADEPLPLPNLGQAVSPGWAGRYPRELHSEIARLAGLLEDAEARVAHWLAADLPDAARLEREILALEKRLPETAPERRPALETRLANLRTRLARPAALSPARLERLRARLGRAWSRSVLDHWESTLDARLPAALHQLLEVETLPPWLLENRNLALLAAASRLAESPRRLAYRLFRLRCGPPPWDLRDAPENRRFIDSLPHLDWNPWIDGVGTAAVSATSGSVEKKLLLALEDDPLEIFRMGSHFQTCLTPGSMNYFSVFANAADVNKRVLFAREAGTGKVLGRCLLALTGTGELLTFEPYCHDGELEFGEICAELADQLARRMGTVRAVHGKVPALVASRWYDDGPRDLGRCYPALEEGSALRRTLATLHPGELLDELRLRLKPARLDETTLPLVLNLPEIERRPELAVPLLRRVAQCRVLPDATLVTAAHLAARAGSADLVQRLLLPRLLDHLRRGYQNTVQRDERAIELVLRLDPGRACSPSSARPVKNPFTAGWTRSTVTGSKAQRARSMPSTAPARPRRSGCAWPRATTFSPLKTCASARGTPWHQDTEAGSGLRPARALPSGTRGQGGQLSGGNRPCLTCREATRKPLGSPCCSSFCPPPSSTPNGAAVGSTVWFSGGLKPRLWRARP